MKKNMGVIDRSVRILIALVLILLFVTKAVSGILAIILLIFSGIFIITSVLGICPLYLPFKISTTKKE